MSEAKIKAFKSFEEFKKLCLPQASRQEKQGLPRPDEIGDTMARQSLPRFKKILLA